MKKVTGIGGIFFKCKNLGLDTEKWGTNFELRQGSDPEKKVFTQWSPCYGRQTTFQPPL